MKKGVAVGFVLLFSLLATAQFEHPDLKSGKKQIRSVVVLPVQAQLAKVGIKGGEPMMEESMQVERQLTPIVSEVLRKLGCAVDDKTFSPESLAQDPELRYAVDDLQKQFDEELKQMHRKSKDVRKGRFSLGDSVAKLPAVNQADALLFVRASGQVLTGGKKTFGWVVGGQKFDTVQMDIGLVDGQSGAVLYFSKPHMIMNLVKKTAEASSEIEESLKNIVRTDAALKSPQKSPQPVKDF
jgi:hypothetical protein